MNIEKQPLASPPGSPSDRLTFGRIRCRTSMKTAAHEDVSCRFTGNFNQERTKLMFSKQQTALTTIGAAALACLLATQVAWTDRASESRRLEGAWIAKVPGTPLRWSYVMSPSDPSGKRAAISGSLQVGIPVDVMFPGVIPQLDYNSDMTGEVVMTSPNTADFTVVGYGMKKIAPTMEYPFTEQVVLIWVTSGQVKFTAPGKAEVAHHLAYYLPAADADGDGLPDAGQSPILCLPVTTSLDTRAGLMAPCAP